MCHGSFLLHSELVTSCDFQLMIPIVSDLWLAVQGAVGLEQLPEIRGVSPLGAQ